MKKKLPSILLCLCMVVTLLPTVALATNATSVTVGDVELTSTNPYFVNNAAASSGTLGVGGCTAHFDSGTATLTLHNFTYSGTTAAISTSGDLTIDLPDGTESTVTNSGGNNSDAIACGGKLTINGHGSGTLNVYGKMTMLDLKISGIHIVDAMLVMPPKGGYTSYWVPALDYDYTNQTDTISAVISAKADQPIRITGKPVYVLYSGKMIVSSDPQNIPTWSEKGYTFAGWFPQPNGQGTRSDTDGTPFTGAAGALYYAKWTAGAKSYTVRTTALDLRGQTATDTSRYTNEGWKFEVSGDSKTLTLDSCTVDCADWTALTVPAGTAIVLAAGTTSNLYGAGGGISAKGNLSFSGKGALNVTSGGKYALEFPYTYIEDTNTTVIHELTIADAALRFSCINPSLGRSCAIGEYVAVTVNSGSVHAQACAVEDYDMSTPMSTGIRATTLTVNAGSVTAVAGDVSCVNYASYDDIQEAYSLGIIAAVKVGASGQVTATAGNVSTGKIAVSSGIYYAFGEGLAFEAAGSVSATGGNATGQTNAVSYGIYTSGTGSVAGDVSATGGNATGGADGQAASYGIYAFNGYSVTGSVYATCGVGGTGGIDNDSRLYWVPSMAICSKAKSAITTAKDITGNANTGIRRDQHTTAWICDKDTTDSFNRPNDFYCGIFMEKAGTTPAKSVQIGIPPMKEQAAASVAVSSTSVTFPAAPTVTPPTVADEAVITYAITSDTSGAASNVASISGTTITLLKTGSFYVQAAIGKTLDYNAKTIYSERITVNAGTLSFTSGVNGAGGTYDGATAYSITAPANLDGATLKYSTLTGSGTQPDNSTFTSDTNPALVNAGTYYVWYQVSKPGYATVTESRTVTVAAKEITGGVAISGTGKFGETLTATYTKGSDSGETVTYQWKRGTTIIPGASNTTYKTVAADVGQFIAVDVTGSGNYTGTKTAVIEVKKAEQAAPTCVVTITQNDNAEAFTATIAEVTGAEYSFDGTTYSGTRTKTDCAAEANVTGYVRMKETATHHAGTPASDVKTASTLAAAAPVISPNGGAISAATLVSLTSATTGAKIYYTLDGTDPTSASTLYTAAFNVTPGQTVKAIAYNGSNAAPSTAVSASFTQQSSSGGSYTPSLVTEIKQGGSTTADNLSRLVSGKKELTVTGADGAKLVFDTTSLKGIDAKTTGSVTVKIEDVSKAHQDTHEGKMVFSLTVLSGGKTISDFGGSVKVSLPYTLKDGESADDVTVWYLAADGTMTEIPCTYDAKTGLATFTVSHFSEYVVGVSEWVNPFSDVKETDWFYDDAAFVAAKSLMSGTSATTFAPYENTSRGMIVTILYRLEGQPTVTGATSFDDVAAGAYYERAIIWAAQNSIVGGYGNGKFGPDDDITREQMAAILYRYAAFKGYDMTATADLSKFADADKIGTWATTALSWANANGLVTGKGNGILDPQGNAERCQVAAILHRFCENVVK